MLDVCVVAGIILLVFIEYQLLWFSCYRPHWGPFWKPRLRKWAGDVSDNQSPGTSPPDPRPPE